MPERSEMFGEFNIGRWDTTIQANEPFEARWESAADDPYKDILIPLPRPEWFDYDLSAAGYVERTHNEEGVDTEFSFGGSIMTWGQRTEQFNRMDECQRNPSLFIDYYNENMRNDDLWAPLSYGARREYDGDHYLCINPTCHRAFFFDQDEPYRALRVCQHCGCMTMVRADILMEHGVPDGVTQSLLAQDIMGLRERQQLNGLLVEMTSMTDNARIYYRSQRPYLYIDTDIPQLRTEGDHFIRGRVNREVLSEGGFDTDSSRVMIGFQQSNRRMIELLHRMLADEGIMLDESKAEKFRQEFIDTRWDEEFIVFAEHMRRSGQLIVDSSGVHDTLTALYNMAQKRAGKKTIIKRDGSIVFPTQDVLENISQPLVDKAFSITEHGRYDNATEVFAVGVGVEE